MVWAFEISVSNINKKFNWGENEILQKIESL